MVIILKPHDSAEKILDKVKAFLAERGMNISQEKTNDDEKVHLHHVDGNHNNWKTSNLLAAHESCHQYIHMSKREQSPN